MRSLRSSPKNKVSAKTLTVVLQGGIGNQLFQFFGGYYLAKNLNRELVVDESLVQIGKSGHGISISEFLQGSFFNGQIKKQNYLKIKYIHFRMRVASNSEHFAKAMNQISTVYCQKEVGFSSAPKIGPKIKYILGYFQSYRYIQESDVLTSMRNHIDETYNSLQNSGRISSSISEYVGVHIRGGDYLKGDHIQGNLSHRYFDEALSLLVKGDSKKPIIVFTDDFEYASTLVSKMRIFRERIVIVNPKDYSPIETLSIMANISSMVISNSTFAWWGAFLGSKNRKIVAPRNWFHNRPNPRDINCKNWLMSDSYWY